MGRMRHRNIWLVIATRRSVLLRRQVLVLLFADKSCMWAPPAGLLPFRRALLEKESEGQALIEARKMPRAPLFGAAVKARCGPWLTLCRAVVGSKGPGEPSRSPQPPCCKSPVCRKVSSVAPGRSIAHA